MEKYNYDHYEGLFNKYQLKRLYKFYSLTDGKIKNDLDESKLNTLKDLKVWVDIADKQNDPFEFVNIDLDNSINLNGLNQNLFGSYNETINKINSYRKSIKITSFTTLMDGNISMWSYYTNNFHGFCCEFEINNMNSSNKNIIHRIKYDDQMHKINYNSLETYNNLKSLNFNTHNQEFEFLENLIKNLTCYKAVCWEHEEEYRAVYFGNEVKQGQDSGEKVELSKLNLKLKAIYIGINCNYESEIIDIAKEIEKKYYKIDVYKIDKEKDRYKFKNVKKY